MRFEMCSEKGCDAEVSIDDSDNLCGSCVGGGVHGCGKLFCSEHLMAPGNPPPEFNFLCEACAKKWAENTP